MAGIDITSVNRQAKDILKALNMQISGLDRIDI